jgi:hypothetical protein
MLRFIGKPRLSLNQPSEPDLRPPSLRQASEQYLTSDQLAAHFLRQVNDRAQ